MQMNKCLKNTCVLSFLVFPWDETVQTLEHMFLRSLSFNMKVIVSCSNSGGSLITEHLERLSNQQQSLLINTLPNLGLYHLLWTSLHLLVFTGTLSQPK